MKQKKSTTISLHHRPAKYQGDPKFVARIIYAEDFIRPYLLIIAVLMALLCLVCRPAQADLFTTDLASGGDTFFDSFNNVDDAFDQLTTAELQAALPSYVDPASTAAAIIDYRGLPMNFAFPVSGSTELTMVIPSLGINESFIGATRDDSKDLLVEYLEGQGSSTVEKIQKELAKVSPTDPVAGNPSSLMGRTVSADFDLAMSMTSSQFASTPGGLDLLRRVVTRSSMEKASASGSGSGGSDLSGGAGSEGSSSDGFSASTLNESSFGTSGGRFGFDLSHTDMDLEGDDAATETLTFEYQYQFADPQKILRVKLPVAMTDTEGAKTYAVNAGVDFSYPVTRSWSLTPGISYGVGGSEDLGGGASMNGYSLTSSYRFVYGDYLYNIGNMVGRYETGSVSLGDYEIDPGISNTVFRNGLVVFRPTRMFEIPTMVQFFGIDTRYTGDDLFTEHYYEFGIAFGLITDEDVLGNNGFNLGLTYLNSGDTDIKGYKINFGYHF